MVRKVFVTGSILVLFGYMIFLAGSAPGHNHGTQKTNSYKYDISKYRVVDEKLVTHQEISSINLKLRKPIALAIDDEHMLYVVGDSILIKLDGMGRELKRVTLSEKPYCITAYKGQLFIGVENHVEVYNADCELQQKWKPYSTTSIITSIAVTDTLAFLADAMMEIVVKTDHDGNVLGLIGGKDVEKGIEKLVIPSLYFDVAIDPDGYLWMVNPGKHLVTNFTHDGGLRTQWGTAGMEVENFSGCCNPGHIAILNNGNFVTAEKGIERVKVHNTSGALIGVVAIPDNFDVGTEGLDLATDSEDRIYILDPVKKQVRVFDVK